MIINSTIADLDTIFALYDKAVAFQKTRFDKHWQAFDRDMILREIAENRQWKIMEEGEVACIFAVVYNDPFIWGDKNADPAMYLHRIATNPAFKGRNYVQRIVDWAHMHAREKGLQYIRLDTWGDNEKLKLHYLRCGFSFLGTITPEVTSALPRHYSAITLGLFEIKM